MLAAMLPFVKRRETVDGLEGTFTLYYLSRFMLSYGLTDLLERGETPIITNLGATGITKGAVNWDDLQFARKYSVVQATSAPGGRTTARGALCPEPPGRADQVLDGATAVHEERHQPPPATAPDGRRMGWPRCSQSPRRKSVRDTLGVMENSRTSD